MKKASNNASKKPQNEEKVVNKSGSQPNDAKEMNSQEYEEETLEIKSYSLRHLLFGGKKTYIFPKNVYLNIKSCGFRDDVKFIFHDKANITFSDNRFYGSVFFEHYGEADFNITDCSFSASTKIIFHEESKLSFHENKCFDDIFFKGNGKANIDVKNCIVYEKGNIRVDSKCQMSFKREPNSSENMDKIYKLPTPDEQETELKLRFLAPLISPSSSYEHHYEWERNYSLTGLYFPPKPRSKLFFEIIILCCCYICVYVYLFIVSLQ